VQNLMDQPIGTTDGVTADSSVRVFFHSGPTATGGSGSVSVANPDGTGAFTATGQPFFRYPGMLAPLETSAAKHWAFTVEAGVTTFAFTLLVSAPAPREAGRVDVTPARPYVAAGSTRQMSATVRTGAGGVVAGAAVTWGSSDYTVATVDANGLVTAHAAGTVTITATSGARTGFATLTVTEGSGDVTPATLGSFSFTPHHVDVTSGPASVTVTVGIEDAGTGAGSMSVVFRSPSGANDLSCNTASPSGGTPANAIYQCVITVPQGTEAGIWQVAFIALRDQVDNLTNVQPADLQAAGYWTALRIDSEPDTEGPTLVGLSFAPDEIDITSAAVPVTVTFRATDAGSGVTTASLMFRSPSGTRDVPCSVSGLSGGTPQDGTLQCTALFPRGSETGNWEVAFVALRDAADNLRTVQTAEIAAAGLPTTVEVTGTADLNAPVLTSFSFSPTAVDVSVAPRGVAVTVGATDDHTGVGIMNVVFESPSTNQTQSCQPVRTSGTDQDGVFSCSLTIPQGAEGGSWKVKFVVLYDQANNLRTVQGSELQTAGYNTTLTVTSN